MMLKKIQPYFLGSYTLNNKQNINIFLGDVKLQIFWSCIAFLIVSFAHDDGMGECRLFDGEWVRKPYGESSLAYTNKSCPTMPDWKNCFKYGRVDTDFLNWRWKPNDCELSRFDPCKFLRIVRGKRMGFIGDSISRNHLDSLICLLSKEEAPIHIYNDSDDRFPAWHFPNHDFTLLALWSKFLVAEDELIVNGSNSDMTWGCTAEEEYAKILSHELLFNYVEIHWGWAVYEENDSFRDVNPWMRDRIIEWCRKQSWYKEFMDEVDAAEAQAAAEAQ